MEFEFSGEPHGKLGLTPASHRGFWTWEFYMDSPVVLKVDDREIHLISTDDGKKGKSQSWPIELLQKVNLGAPSSSSPYLELYFKDGSMTNIHQFGISKAELKAIQHRLRTLIKTGGKQ